MLTLLWWTFVAPYLLLVLWSAWCIWRAVKDLEGDVEGDADE